MCATKVMKLRRILEKVEAASGFTSEEKGRRMKDNFYCALICANLTVLLLYFVELLQLSNLS